MKKKAQKVIGIRVDGDVAARAQEKAKAQHRTVSQVLRMLLEDWLKAA